MTKLSRPGTLPDCQGWKPPIADLVGFVGAYHVTALWRTGHEQGRGMARRTQQSQQSQQRMTRARAALARANKKAGMVIP